MDRAMDLLRERGAADCPFQAILVKGYGHRLPRSCLRYPTFPSEVVPSPITCQIFTTLLDGATNRPRDTGVPVAPSRFIRPQVLGHPSSYQC